MRELQQLLADPGRVAPSVDELLESALQVRPAGLALQHGQVAVGLVAIGAHDGGGVVSQELTGHLAVAARTDGKYGDQIGGHGPQPGVFARFAPAGLIDMHRRLLPHVVACVFDRSRQRLGHMLFQLADRADGQIEAERVGEQGDDVALAHPVGARQQTDPGLHTRTKAAAWHRLGPVGFGEHVAARTAQGVHLVLGDLRSYRRDLEHLAALRMGIVAAQGVAALSARGGLDRHQRVHLLHRQQRSPMPLVPGLCPWRAARRALAATRRRGARLFALAGWRRLVGRRRSMTTAPAALQLGHLAFQHETQAMRIWRCFCRRERRHQIVSLFRGWSSVGELVAKLLAGERE